MEPNIPQEKNRAGLWVLAVLPLLLILWILLLGRRPLLGWDYAEMFFWAALSSSGAWRLIAARRRMPAGPREE